MLFRLAVFNGMSVVFFYFRGGLSFYLYVIWIRLGVGVVLLGVYRLKGYYNNNKLGEMK